MIGKAIRHFSDVVIPLLPLMEADLVIANAFPLVSFSPPY
jgi:hypothetical protein